MWKGSNMMEDPKKTRVDDLTKRDVEKARVSIMSIAYAKIKQGISKVEIMEYIERTEKSSYLYKEMKQKIIRIEDMAQIIEAIQERDTGTTLINNSPSLLNKGNNR